MRIEIASADWKPLEVGATSGSGPKPGAAWGLSGASVLPRGSGAPKQTIKGYDRSQNAVGLQGYARATIAPTALMASMLSKLLQLRV